MLRRAQGGNATACWKRPELCHGNPYYFVGRAAAGLGSGHQSHGLRNLNYGPQCDADCIWPLGLVMEAMTSGSAAREREILCLLLETTDGQFLMHEGFNADLPSHYNRDQFGWANALFASWVLESRGLREGGPLIC